MKKIFAIMVIIVMFFVGVIAGMVIQREGINSKRAIAICDEYYEKYIVEYKVVNLFDVETIITVVDLDTNEADTELHIWDGNIYVIEY